MAHERQFVAARLPYFGTTLEDLPQEIRDDIYERLMPAELKMLGEVYHTNLMYLPAGAHSDSHRAPRMKKIAPQGAWSAISRLLRTSKRMSVEVMATWRRMQKNIDLSIDLSTLRHNPCLKKGPAPTLPAGMNTGLRMNAARINRLIVKELYHFRMLTVVAGGLTLSEETFETFSLVLVKRKDGVWNTNDSFWETAAATPPLHLAAWKTDGAAQMIHAARQAEIMAQLVHFVDRLLHHYPLSSRVVCCLQQEMATTCATSFVGHHPASVRVFPALGSEKATVFGLPPDEKEFRKYNKKLLKMEKAAKKMHARSEMEGRGFLCSTWSRRMGT